MTQPIAVDQPPFDYTTVTAEVVRAACDDAIVRCAPSSMLAPASRMARTFANTVRPLDEVAAQLNIASGRYGFLGYVAADEELRTTALAYEEKLDTYATTTGFRKDVYAALSAYAATDEARALVEPVIAKGYRGLDPSALIHGGTETVTAKFCEFAAMGYTDIVTRGLLSDQSKNVESLERLGDVRERVRGA